jgi:hypothetical protein
MKTAIATLSMPDTSKVWGIDISHWNTPPVDLKRMVDLYGLKLSSSKAASGSLNTRLLFEHVAAAEVSGDTLGYVRMALSKQQS